MKKTITIALVLLLVIAFSGCTTNESSTFTHGTYEVAYQTELTATEDGQPAVKVLYSYFKQDGKKKDLSSIGMVFGDGGISGMYLKVDGLAYPIGEVNVQVAGNKTEVISVIAVPNATESSSIEVCYAGLEHYVERNGNRFYYAPYRLAEPAENGNAQLLIDFSYVNGMELVHKGDFISGGYPNIVEPLFLAMADQYFVVVVNGVEYEAEGLNAQTNGEQDGSPQYSRVRLLIEIPADTPLDAEVEVR